MGEWGAILLGESGGSGDEGGEGDCCGFRVVMERGEASEAVY